MTAIRVCVLALIMAAAYISPAAATNYFSWGAESTAAQKMTCPFDSTTTNYTFNFNGRQQCDATAAHSGSCGVVQQVTGVGGNESEGLDTISPGCYPFNIINAPALYYRWYMKMMTGFVWGGTTHKAKASRVQIGSNLELGGYTGYIGSEGFSIQECAANGLTTGCRDANGVHNSGDGGIVAPFDLNSLADSQWHEYIVMVKPNTCAGSTTPPTCFDAQLKVWIDGTLAAQYLNWQLTSANDTSGATERWGAWGLGFYFQMNCPSGCGGTMYLDDWSIDDTFNSLIGPGGGACSNSGTALMMSGGALWLQGGSLACNPP